MLDLSDSFGELRKYKIREYNQPFLTIFTQANNPDEICHEIILRLVNKILSIDETIEARILCVQIRRTCRFDRIQEL